jgi:hypothetical protein
MGAVLDKIAKTKIENPYDKPYPGSGRLGYIQLAYKELQTEAKSIIATLKATPLVRSGKPNTGVIETISGKFGFMQKHFDFYCQPFKTNHKTALVKPLEDNIKKANAYWQKAKELLS